MGGTDCGDNWVLLWWVRPCSENLQFMFLLIDGAVLLPCSLVLGSPVLDSAGSTIGLMVTFSQRTYANTLCLPRRLLPVLLSPQQATAEPCLHRKLPNIHRQAGLAQSLVGVKCYQSIRCYFVIYIFTSLIIINQILY